MLGLLQIPNSEQLIGIEKFGSDSALQIVFHSINIYGMDNMEYQAGIYTLSEQFISKIQTNLIFFFFHIIFH
jgi:hypothetical protein